MSSELWHCPRCGRTFANRNQSHTCAPLGDLERHFAGKDECVRQAFDAVVAVVDALGPVEVLAEKSRIALHVRMSFAAFTPRRSTLPGHLVLAREVPSARWDRIEHLVASGGRLPSAGVSGARMLANELVGGTALRRGDLRAAAEPLSTLRDDALTSAEPQRILPGQAGDVAVEAAAQAAFRRHDD